MRHHSTADTGLARHAGVSWRAACTKHLLGLLLVFVALNAFGGGFYGLAGAKGVPREWLSASPFSDYLVPSLFLVFLIGGASLGAAMAVFAGLPSARRLAMGAGVVLVVWIAAEVAIIGAESWLQLATAVVGGVIVALGRSMSTPS